MIDKIFSFFQKKHEEPIESDVEDLQQPPEIIAEPPQPEPQARCHRNPLEPVRTN